MRQIIYLIFTIMSSRDTQCNIMSEGKETLIRLWCISCLHWNKSSSSIIY
ncbi:hypothetical protein E2C01_028055 [Portunus trituberculatus]|uniref:Uncharacterized protein n=1 Tax=Portunus trituberculatus TaxID=210409 RepID=A0A5B7EJJ1_PORTR|nr:hypothetical protein [Portunus trituberculatus]